MDEFLTDANTEPVGSWSVGEVGWFDETGATRFLCIKLNGRYFLLLEEQAHGIIEALTTGVSL